MSMPRSGDWPVSRPSRAWVKVVRRAHVRSDLCSNRNNTPTSFKSLQGQLYDWRLWAARSVVLAFASMAGLTVVAFTWMCEFAFEHFREVQQQHWWSPLLWTPVMTALIVWLTRRFAPGAAGSGIPQVMAALAPEVHAPVRHFFVSTWLTVSKMVLTAWACWPACRWAAKGRRCRSAPGSCTAVATGCPNAAWCRTMAC